MAAYTVRKAKFEFRHIWQADFPQIPNAPPLPASGRPTDLGPPPPTSCLKERERESGHVRMVGGGCNARKGKVWRKNEGKQRESTKNMNGLGICGDDKRDDEKECNTKRNFNIFYEAYADLSKVLHTSYIKNRVKTQE
jgi:hypothetical protein